MPGDLRWGLPYSSAHSLNPQLSAACRRPFYPSAARNPPPLLLSPPSSPYYTLYPLAINPAIDHLESKAFSAPFTWALWVFFCCFVSFLLPCFSPFFGFTPFTLSGFVGWPVRECVLIFSLCSYPHVLSLCLSNVRM